MLKILFSFYQLLIIGPDGSKLDRISPWATYVKNFDKNIVYDQVFYNPPSVFCKNTLLNSLEIWI